MLTPIGRFHFTFEQRRSRTGKEPLATLVRSGAGNRIRLVAAALGHNSPSVSRATECSCEYCAHAITHLSLGRPIRSRRQDSRALDRIDDRVFHVARCGCGGFPSQWIRESVDGTADERARQAATNFARPPAKGQRRRYRTLAGHVAGRTRRSRSAGRHRESTFDAESRGIDGLPWAIAGDSRTLRAAIGLVNPVTSTFTCVAAANVVCVSATGS